MARDIDKNTQNLIKQAVIKQYIDFTKNPQSVLETDANGKYSNIESFFNNFANAYILPALKGYEQHFKNGQLPNVEMKDARDVYGIPDLNNQNETDQEFHTSAIGEYNSNDNKVYMYTNALQELKGAPPQKIISKLNQLISILCHEYQHSKQRLHKNLLDSGEVEKANKIASQLGSNPSAIAEDFDFNGFESLRFIKATREDLATQLRGNRKSKTGDPLEEAFYYTRPIEVDARTTSLQTFTEFSVGVLKSKNIKPFADLLKTTCSSLQSHFKDMTKQKPISKEQIQEAIKKLEPDDFVKYAKRVEGGFSRLPEDKKSKISLNSILNGEHMSDSRDSQEKSDEQDREIFVCALEDYVKTCPENAEATLKEIKQKCEEEGLSFGEIISSQYIQMLQEPAVRQINTEDYKKEGLDPNQSKEQAQAPDTSRSREQREAGLDLTEEEQNQQQIQ